MPFMRGGFASMIFLLDDVHVEMSGSTIRGFVRCRSCTRSLAVRYVTRGAVVVLCRATFSGLLPHSSHTWPFGLPLFPIQFFLGFFLFFGNKAIKQ